MVSYVLGGIMLLALIGGLLFVTNVDKFVGRASKKEMANLQDLERMVSVDDLYDIKDIHGGVVYTSTECIVLAKIEGMNASVLSAYQQDGREAAIIETLAQTPYPYKTVSNTVVADTTAVSKAVYETAINLPEDSSLYHYCELYMIALEEMRLSRSILTQQTFLFIPGSSPDECHERIRILSMGLTDKGGITITPLTTTEEVYDALKDIIMPDRIVNPSQFAEGGVVSPIHFGKKELKAYVQKENINQKFNPAIAASN